ERLDAAAHCAIVARADVEGVAVLAARAVEVVLIAALTQGEVRDERTDLGCRFSFGQVRFPPLSIWCGVRWTKVYRRQPCLGSHRHCVPVVPGASRRDANATKPGPLPGSPATAASMRRVRKPGRARSPWRVRPPCRQ